MKQHQGERVAARAGRFVEPDPGEHRGQVEQGGQHILALDDPGHRLDVQRVDGEQRSDQHGAGHGKAGEQAPEQEAVRQVQEDVDGVVADRVQAPEFVFQPERGVDQRPVVTFVLDVGGRQPDAAQAVGRVDDRFLGEDHVVPHEAALQRRKVAHHYQQSHCHDNSPAWRRRQTRSHVYRSGRTVEAAWCRGIGRVRFPARRPYGDRTL